MLRLLATALLVLLVALPTRAQRLWPVSGTVTESYGMVVNGPGVASPNPGVFIASPAAVPVRAVVEGTVAKVDMMPEYGAYVLVRHGEILTAYANLSQVRVREGDAVRSGQVLGDTGTPQTPKGEGLFFAVFRHDAQNARAVTLDPLAWLRGE